LIEQGCHREFPWRVCLEASLEVSDLRRAIRDRLRKNGKLPSSMSCITGSILRINQEP
jgi:hypothetical protein